MINNFKNDFFQITKAFAKFDYDCDLASVKSEQIWKNETNDFVKAFSDPNKYKTTTISGQGLFAKIEFDFDQTVIDNVQGQYELGRIRTNNNQVGYLLTTKADEQLLVRSAELIQSGYFNNVVIMPDGHITQTNIVGFSAKASKDQNGDPILSPIIVGPDIGCGILSAHFNDAVFANQDLKQLLGAIDQGVVNLIPAGQAAEHHLEAMIKGNWFANLFDGSYYQLVKNQVEKFLQASYFYQNLPIQEQIIMVNSIVANSGTLGDGNHFIEINQDQNGKQILNIHSGSRNFGGIVYQYYQKLAKKQAHQNHQLLQKDYEKQVANLKLQYQNQILDQKQMQAAVKAAKQQFNQAKKQLVNDGLDLLSGELALNYYHDLKIAQTYGAFNRELMMFVISQYLKNVILKNPDLKVFNKKYHNIHNSAFKIGGEYVLLKGTILGQVVNVTNDKDKIHPNTIALNMADGIISTYPQYDVNNGANVNFALPHGAGRHQSRRAFYENNQSEKMEQFRNLMSDVVSSCVNFHTLDESPQAYKAKADIICQSASLFRDDFEIWKPVYAFKGHRNLPFMENRDLIRKANNDFYYKLRQQNKQNKTL